MLMALFKKKCEIYLGLYDKQTNNVFVYQSYE